MPGLTCRSGRAPRISDGRVVNCFMKCEADRRGTLRGRRQIMLDNSDVHHHRHSKAAVGGVAAAAIGDPAVFVSVDAMHQGPQGGGPVDRHHRCRRMRAWRGTGIASKWARHPGQRTGYREFRRAMNGVSRMSKKSEGYHDRCLHDASRGPWRLSHWSRPARRRPPPPGQGQGRRVPDQLVAAVFRRDRSRLLQGTQHRAGDHQADGRAAERRGADHQPDRSLRGAGDARRPQRRRQEAGRGDVHRHAQPEPRPTRWSSSWCARASSTR